MIVRIPAAQVLGRVLGAMSGNITKSNDNDVRITSSVLLRAIDDRLEVVAADTNSHEVKMTVEATVNAPGSALVFPTYIGKICSGLGTQPIDLTLDGSQIKLVSARQDKVDFPTFQARVETFPVEAALPDRVATVDGDALYDALKTCLNSVTAAGQRLYFDISEDDIVISTSLYITTRTRFKPTAVDTSAQFSVDVGSLTGSRTPRWSGMVTIHRAEGLVAFSCGNEHILVRSGTDAENDLRVINPYLSAPAAASFVVNRRTLMEKVHAVAFSKCSCYFNVTGATEQKNLVVRSDLNNMGSSTMVVRIQGDVVGTIPLLALDPVLVEKALAGLSGEDVRIEYVDMRGDGHFCPRVCDDENPGRRQSLIMPVQNRSQLGA